MTQGGVEGLRRDARLSKLKTTTSTKVGHLSHRPTFSGDCRPMRRSRSVGDQPLKASWHSRGSLKHKVATTSKAAQRWAICPTFSGDCRWPLAAGILNSSKFEGDKLGIACSDDEHYGLPPSQEIAAAGWWYTKLFEVRSKFEVRRR